MDLIVILCSRFSDLATTKYVTKLFFVSDLFANKQYKLINDFEKELTHEEANNADEVPMNKRDHHY